MLSVHSNCLVSCFVIAWGCRPWNTVNTTADICLLVENGNKNTETKCNVCLNLFLVSHLAALCPTLGQWGSLTHLMLVTIFFHAQPEGHQEFRNEFGSQSLTERIRWIGRNFLSNWYSDCMLLSWHIRVSEWIYFLKLPEFQGTPFSKQARYLKFKWQRWDSNPQSLSS